MTSRTPPDFPRVPACHECGEPLPHHDTRYVVPPVVAGDGQFRLANQADLAFGLVACGPCSIREYRRLSRAQRKERTHAA